jgi:hypothetical protein
MLSKLVRLSGAILGLLVMVFSALLSYLAGIWFFYSPFWNSIRQEIRATWFFVSTAASIGEMLLASVLTILGFLLWDLCKQPVQKLKIYLWTAIAVSSLAAVIDILVFCFFALLNLIVGGFATDVPRFLPGPLDILVGIFLLGLLFLGHVICMMFITRYHWRLFRSQP